eukprot:355824-Prymnesium_polylepis.1
MCIRDRFSILPSLIACGQLSARSFERPWMPISARKSEEPKLGGKKTWNVDAKYVTTSSVPEGL